MKRNLLLLAVMVSAVLLFSTQGSAQCPQDTIDLGICDTFYVETFDCDHQYDIGTGYDSVRVAYFVTHDYNEIIHLGNPAGDSISGFVMPFDWYAQAYGGCNFDSVTLPTHSLWNNTISSQFQPPFVRSVFRDIVDTHSGDTTYNRFARMVNDEYLPMYETVLDITSGPNSGHTYLSTIAGGSARRWWEGNRVLIATMTFLVYGMERATCECPDAGVEICMDTTLWPPTGLLEFTRIDATNYKPRGIWPDGEWLEVCDSICIIPNLLPEVACPGDQSHHLNGWVTLSPGVTATDGDGTIQTVNLGFSGNGVTQVQLINESGLGTASYSADVKYFVEDHCQDGGTVTFTATDDKGGQGVCTFDIELTNTAPVITTCPDDDTASTNYFREGETWVSTPFAGTDADFDPLTWSVSTSPATVGPVSICGNQVCWDADVLDTCVTYTFELIVQDLPQPTADTCYFLVHLFPTAGLPNVVEIPNEVWQRYGFDYCYVYDIEDDRVEYHDACPEYIPGAAHPGDFVSIPILLNNFVDPVSIGAFEFEVEFDYIDLTFYGAERGDLLWAVWEEPYELDPTQDVLYSWEYFSYRLCPCTVPACLKYKILVYGQAEMPDGLLRRGYCIDLPNLHPEIEAVDTLNLPLFDLVWFKFQIANNELLRDLKLPVRFEWEAKIEDGVVVDDWDCAENTMSNCDGDILYASNDDIQFGDVCFDEFQYPPEQILTFIDGGIHICSPCSAFKCVRGDINLDHVPNSAADAVMLARAIVLGTHEVYTLDYDAQMCASDLNADGRPAMLADLIYLIRVILRDAVPYPKLGPSSEIANVIVSDGMISVECASEIGGLLFEFDQAVTPTLLATNMELIAHEGRVLVWSSDGNSMNSGEVLSAIGAELVSVTAVDRDGRDLATTITAKVAPSAFALHPAYPNPFNPYTNLSFTLPTASFYTLKIYNVTGQLVRSYEGMGAAGLNVITWDGKDNASNDIASGVYFYKLEAGQHHAIKKMVVLK